MKHTEEILKNKKELEKDIQSLITNFREKNGCFKIEINLKEHYVSEGLKKTLTGEFLEVTLKL